MISKKLQDLLAKIKKPLEDPQFYPEAFSLVAKEHKKSTKDPIKALIEQDYLEISELTDKAKIQDSSSVRNVLKTRELVNYLIDDQGELDFDALQRTISLLEQKIASLGPERQYDYKRHAYMLEVLKTLNTDKKLQLALKRITKPFSHRYAEQLIRDTLQLAPHVLITDAITRRAALSALLCYLRQNVGSCFATAPAIIIHGEQSEQFLSDLQEILGTGRLKRTFGGIEYAVPLSHSWGAGDLKRQLILPTTNIWLSPAFVDALQISGVIDAKKSLAEKIEEAKKLTLNSLGDESLVLTDTEAILRKIILSHMKLSEQDMIDFENRPKGMLRGGILMQVTVSSGKIGEKCAKFEKHFESAKNVFKSYADNALLKAWEFTLASFAETKSEFTKWNLYSSLGFGPQESGGIGERLYAFLQYKVEESNRKMQDLQAQYEQAYSYLQYLQARSRNISSEREASSLRAEHQSKSHEFHTLQEMRDTAHQKAHRYANLFNGLIDIYLKLFPNYFQEVYDADIHNVNVGPYDDQPAGFRLLYKHGRANTSQWTLIYNHNEYIDALANFFTITENEVASSPIGVGLESDITEIVTDIVTHVRTKEFLESAFYRMAVAHKGRIVKNPLENLDKVEKKPWVYTSGGVMGTLVSTYFRREEKPTEVGRWVENPMELLVFFVDAIKQLPEKVLEEFVKNPDKSLIVHSPTHAFLLKPGLPWMQEAWKSKEFTYTWVRDNVVRPMEQFSEKLFLHEEQMQVVTEALLEKVPEKYKEAVKGIFSKLKGAMQVGVFRDFLLDSLNMEQNLSMAISSEEIDSTLYSVLPIFPRYQLKERVEAILNKLPGVNKELILRLLDETSGGVSSMPFISANRLQEIVKALLSLATETSYTDEDYPLQISRAAQELGFAMPTPFIFADTNWVRDEFAFLVNPGTGQLELWRTDYTGTVGAPMSIWKPWLDGTRKEPTWGVYIKPQEYKY